MHRERVIVTNCTQRKRLAASPAVLMRGLSSASPSALASAWFSRLEVDPNRMVARRLYCGRSFSEAVAAASTANSRLWVISAGLGVVDSETPVPSYGAAASTSGPDSVPAKLIDAHPSAWFSELVSRSPFSVPASDISAQLMLVALSRPYLNLVSEWLEGFEVRRPGSVRLFARVEADSLSETLRPALMPYDTRFETLERPGTVNDFPQRALRDFVDNVLSDLPDADAAKHRSAVLARLEGITPPVRPNRVRHDDAEIILLIQRHWSDVAGSSTRMLRLLRDGLSVACEQGRFITLFKQAGETRTGSLL
jgi:hypothetical protein